ncbi:MAG: DUF1559 domain-containing protein [Planctomycetota bacterium]
MGRIRVLVAGLTLVTAMTHSSRIHAQDSAAGNAKKVAHIPAMSISTAVLRPPVLLQSELIQAMPIEVADAWMKQSLGLTLGSVEEIRVVAAMPMGPGTPPFGFVAKLSEPFDPSEMDPDLLLQKEPESFGKREVYLVGSPRDRIMLCVPDPKTVFVATPMMLEQMIVSEGGDGPLANLVGGNLDEDVPFELAISLDPIRPMVAPVMDQMAGQLPPDLRQLSEIPENLQGMIFKTRLRDSMLESKLDLVAVDDAARDRLLQIIEESVTYARDTFVKRMNEEVVGDDPIAQAQRAYAERVSSGWSELLKPKVEDQHLVYEADAGISVASVGVMAGLLLPAVQQARSAARRMQASNNLKQIALAFHNYASAYKKFPGPAITDAAGKPLLSWRVKLLPFIEENDLYEQFHLDEAWNSPHNIKLIDQMPQTFVDPAVVTRPGETVFHMAIGEGFFQEFGKELGFRDCLDGTSNTIMAFEVDSSEQVPWTAPIDVEINLDDPLPAMGHNRPGGFHAVFGDGAVRFLTHDIDVDMFRALLTRAGREIVDVP